MRYLLGYEGFKLYYERANKAILFFSKLFNIIAGFFVILLPLSSLC